MYSAYEIYIPVKKLFIVKYSFLGDMIAIYFIYLYDRGRISTDREIFFVYDLFYQHTHTHTHKHARIRVLYIVYINIAIIVYVNNK